MANFGQGETGDIVNPRVVNRLHSFDDTDATPRSHHHTLGVSPNQAFPGNRGLSLEDSRTTDELRITNLETPAIIGCSPSGNFAGGSSGVPVDITGMSGTFTSRGVNDLFLIIASFDLQIAGSAASTPVGRVSSDLGVVFDTVYGPQVINARATVGQHFITVGFPAGVHTIKGRYWNAAGVGTATVYSGSRLSIVRLN